MAHKERPYKTLILTLCSYMLLLNESLVSIDIDPMSFERLLEFIYTDEVTSTGVELMDWLAIILLARKFCLSRLEVDA